jgi:hypothetical protein
MFLRVVGTFYPPLVKKDFRGRTIGVQWVNVWIFGESFGVISQAIAL